MGNGHSVVSIVRFRGGGDQEVAGGVIGDLIGGNVDGMVAVKGECMIETIVDVYRPVHGRDVRIIDAIHHAQLASVRDRDISAGERRLRSVVNAVERDVLGVGRGIAVLGDGDDLAGVGIARGDIRNIR